MPGILLQTRRTRTPDRLLATPEQQLICKLGWDNNVFESFSVHDIQMSTTSESRSIVTRDEKLGSTSRSNDY